MAIFRPPPQPFVGGWQPLAPRRLPVSITAVPADDPPFSHGGRSSPSSMCVLAMWQPDPATPWRGFVGGRRLPAGLFTPTDDPPFGIQWGLRNVAITSWDPGPPRLEPIRARPGYYLSKDIRGVTRDSGGGAIGNCVVKCYDTLTDAVVFTTTSDASGNYAGTVPGSGEYYLVAYLDGSPDIAGTSVNTLTGS